MQTKTTMSHLTPDRMAIFKKTRNNNGLDGLEDEIVRNNFKWLEAL